MREISEIRVKGNGYIIKDRLARESTPVAAELSADGLIIFKNTNEKNLFTVDISQMKSRTERIIVKQNEMNILSLANNPEQKNECLMVS